MHLRKSPRTHHRKRKRKFPAKTCTENSRRGAPAVGSLNDIKGQRPNRGFSWQAVQLCRCDLGPNIPAERARPCNSAPKTRAGTAGVRAQYIMYQAPSKANPVPVFCCSLVTFYFPAQLVDDFTLATFSTSRGYLAFSPPLRFKYFACNGVRTSEYHTR